MPLKAYIKTFGCQMNVHDSEKMAALLRAEGYVLAATQEEADLVLYNTCSIREKAEQKFLSDLGRLKSEKKKRPGLRIAVAGCIAQQMGRSLISRAPYVDYVLGPQNLHSLGTMLRAEGRGVALDENPDADLLEMPSLRRDAHRAWVSIMYGCNNFCTYCIVPHTRGRETSRPSANIISEVETLARDGFREVTLLGQNVNSYRSDTDFTGLLRALDRVKGIARIRFVTNHPRDLSEDLARAMGELGSVCEHIHLPMQSGSTDVLRRMNRRYTYDEYRAKVDMLRHHVPGIAITSDMICGFPGETGDDHRATLDAIRDIRFDGLFAFRYSARPGTRAVDMDGQLPESLKISRLQEVLDLQDAITSGINTALEGNVLEVLVEGKSDTDPDRLTGRTRTNKVVNFDPPMMGGQGPGRLIDVRITRAGRHSLIGEAVEKLAMATGTRPES